MPWTKKQQFRIVLVLFAVLGMFQAYAWAGSLNLVYQKAILDASGNEIGYQDQTITSINDLPSSSPWRKVLSNPVDQRNMLTYIQDLSKLLARPLSVTLSDRNQVSCSTKDSNGYKLVLYRHVAVDPSVDNQNFVALHELGHIAMLNAYPSYYTFDGLNYGSDNAHYMDEILPNYKTAWVEGWANAFGALKNNGKVFSLPITGTNLLSFLKGNSFDEMNRNELFIARNLYDMFGQITSGKDKVFNVISQTGPHNSMKDFCAGYLKLYPQDQVALATILNNNSQGKMSLTDMLNYLNGGSRTVSRAFYNFLVSSGKIGGAVSSTPPSTSTASNQGSTQKSFWSKIGEFFSGLFGRNASTPNVSVSTAPSVSMGISGVNNMMTNLSLEPGVSLTPMVPTVNSQGDIIPTTGQTAVTSDYPTAQAEYFKAFAEYNQIMSEKSPDPTAVKNAKDKLQAAKANLENLKNQMRGTR